MGYVRPPLALNTPQKHILLTYCLSFDALVNIVKHQASSSVDILTNTSNFVLPKHDALQQTPVAAKDKSTEPVGCSAVFLMLLDSANGYSSLMPDQSTPRSKAYS